jgi:hypothetical protein
MALSLSAGLVGCASQDVANPGNITLTNALTDTVDAIYAARKESIRIQQREGLPPIGLSPCTVTAKFSVAAKATSDQKLSLTAAAPTVTVIPVSLGASAEATVSGERSNTVEVVFNNRYCGAGSSGAGK